MAHVSTSQNTPVDIDLRQDYLNNGWAISGGKAIHDSCNSGLIINRNLITEAGTSYTVTFTISGYQSGQVYPIIGGIDGSPVTSNGTFNQTITADDDSGLSFWSDGDLEVSIVILTSFDVPATTIAFNERNLKWVTYYSFAPEMMGKFIDGFYSFQEGVLWEHNVNEDRNAFYGVTYPSRITFYVNENPTTVKNLQSIRFNSNKPWSVTSVKISPFEGKPNGQQSYIKKGNFKRVNRQWFADFLRDINDPRFMNELQALFKGAFLQGQIAEITIEIEDVGEVKLLSVDTTMYAQQYTY